MIADATANPVFVAADLLSQAEHGADSQVLLVTTSAELASAVAAQVESQKATLPRREIVDGALGHSRAVVVADLAEAFEISNALRARALDPASRAAARLAAASPRRGLRVPRAVDARDRRRLLQRNEPRAADLRLRAALFEPRRRRFSALDDGARAHVGRVARDRADRDHARRARGPRRARARGHAAPRRDRRDRRRRHGDERARSRAARAARHTPVRAGPVGARPRCVSTRTNRRGARRATRPSAG